MTDKEVDDFRSRPPGTVRLTAAATIPRECRTEQDWVYQPGQFDAITAPTLMLTGSESDPVVVEATEQAAAAIPDAQIRVLQGHDHFAHRTDPTMVATIIHRFIAP
jgi:pimeloyl-ACP methyl ester carboxylesterase